MIRAMGNRGTARRGRRLAVAAAGLLALGAPAAAQANTPTLTIDDPSVAEGTGGTTTVTFTVTLSAAQPTAVTFQFQTLNNTAQNPVDFTGRNGAGTIAPGETTTTIPVTVISDNIDEADEQLRLQISDAVGATITNPFGDATIVDDDAPPVLDVEDATVQGGREGTGANRLVVFTVRLVGGTTGSGRNVTVDYATQAGSATSIGPNDPPSSGDFEQKTGTLTFFPGNLSQNVTVVVRADTVDELDEAFTLKLNAPTNATLGRDTATGAIPDDDGPAIAITDAVIPEGGPGQQTTRILDVTLDEPSVQPVSVKVASANDTATVNEDYLPVASTTVTIPPGETRASVAVTAVGDDLDEADEAFRVVLSAPEDGELGDTFGLVSIPDDDVAPQLTATSPQVAEGTGGQTTATIALQLERPAGRGTTVRYQTVPETATSGVDFLAAGDQVVFGPGETRKEIAVTVAPDAELEDDETFRIDVVHDAGGQQLSSRVTVLDDDLTAGVTPALSVRNARVVEGDRGERPATFTVAMDRPLPRTVRVAYATKDATAKAPGDFAPSSGTLTFKPGETTQTIEVPVRGDDLVEGPESFTVELRDPVNARIADGSGVGVVVDDDAGLARSGVAARRVAAGQVLCVARSRCRGLLVRWTTQVRGTLEVEVDTLLPARTAKGSAGAAPRKQKPKRIRLLRTRATLRRPGSGQRRVAVRSSAEARRLLRRLRAGGAKELRVTVAFQNRQGAREEQVHRVGLRR